MVLFSTGKKNLCFSTMGSLFFLVCIKVVLYFVFALLSVKVSMLFYLSTDTDDVVEGICIVCEECVELISVHISRSG